MTAKWKFAGKKKLPAERLIYEDQHQYASEKLDLW